MDDFSFYYPELVLSVDLTMPGEIERAIETLEEARGAQIFMFSGESADCDTCGPDFPEGSLVVIGDKVVLETRYGCYGGYWGTDIEEIRDELTHIRKIMSGPFDEALEALP